MNLVTDRTWTDVVQRTAKGQYGPEDLNRVEQAVWQLYQLAKLLDVAYTPPVKTDWMRPETFSAIQWPTVSQMRRYLDNVNRLCAAVELAAKLPISMENLDWQGANQIEEALQAVYCRIQNILQTFQYSGEIFAGEENYI